MCVVRTRRQSRMHTNRRIHNKMGSKRQRERHSERERERERESARDRERARGLGVSERYVCVVPHGAIGLRTPFILLRARRVGRYLCDVHSI